MQTKTEGPNGFVELDYGFHMEIGRIADNHFLKTMLDMLHANIHEFILRTVQDFTVSRKAYQDHRKILECIEAGNTDQARSVMERHILTCMHHYKQQYAD